MYWNRYTGRAASKNSGPEKRMSQTTKSDRVKVISFWISVIKMIFVVIFVLCLLFNLKNGKTFVNVIENDEECHQKSDLMFNFLDSYGSYMIRLYVCISNTSTLLLRGLKCNTYFLSIRNYLTERKKGC